MGRVFVPVTDLAEVGYRMRNLFRHRVAATNPPPQAAKTSAEGSGTTANEADGKGLKWSAQTV